MEERWETPATRLADSTGALAPGRVKARCATGLDPSSPIYRKWYASGTSPDACREEERSAQRSISRSFFRFRSSRSRSSRSCLSRRLYW